MERFLPAPGSRPPAAPDAVFVDVGAVRLVGGRPEIEIREIDGLAGSIPNKRLLVPTPV